MNVNNLPHVDKLNHFCLWFTFAAIAGLAAPTYVVVAAGVMLAALKEYLDGDRNSLLEHLMDFAAGVAGTIAGVSI